VRSPGVGLIMTCVYVGRVSASLPTLGGRRGGRRGRLWWTRRSLVDSPFAACRRVRCV